MDSWLIAKTSAAWMAVLYIVCAVGFILLPSTTIDFLWKPMFHALGLQATDPTFLVIGLVEAVVYTALAGWLFAALYNYFSKR